MTGNERFVNLLSISQFLYFWHQLAIILELPFFPSPQDILITIPITSAKKLTQTQCTSAPAPHAQTYTSDSKGMGEMGSDNAFFPPLIEALSTY